MNDEAQRQLQSSLGQQANAMRYGDYWNNLNFDKSVYDTSFNQNQQQFNNALGVLNLGNQANVQNLGLGQQIQNAPLDYWGQFSNQANTFGRGFGSQSSTSSGSGSPLAGAIGGWQLGGAFGKALGGGGSTGYDSWQTAGNGMPSWFSIDN
jgi:hypothetical protein